MKKIIYLLLICTFVLFGACSDNDDDNDDNKNDNSVEIVYYKDLDNDGFSDGTPLKSDTQPENYYPESEIQISGDCNDNDSNIYPGANEICNDGIDQDCDGKDCIISSDIPAEINDNPAVGIFINGDQINYGADISSWILQASEHWKARQENSWSDYINDIITPNPPESLPNLPVLVQQNDSICEAVGEGRCFYIDAENGDDNNDGTFDRPWRTYLNITNYYPGNDCAIKPDNWIELKSGDVVYFMSGKYKESYDWDWNCERRYGLLLLDLKGTKDKPIVIKSYPGTHPVINNNTQADGITLGSCSNVVIKGLEITNNFGSGISLGGCNNIQMRNLWIHNNDGHVSANAAGIYVSNSENVIIENNIINDNYDRRQQRFDWNTGNIVFFGGGNNRVNRNIIYYSINNSNNTSYTGKGFGVKYKHAATVANSSFEVDSNVLWNCYYTSIGSGTPRTYIHHNLIMDSHSIRFADWGGESYHLDNVVENNTIIRGQALSYNPSNNYGPIGLMTFKNNFVIDDTVSYGSETGIIDICVYCSDEIYERTVTDGNLLFQRNYYFNPHIDLNVDKSWLLFNFIGELNEKGGTYNFIQWQSLGYDLDSIAQ